MHKQRGGAARHDLVAADTLNSGLASGLWISSYLWIAG